MPADSYEAEIIGAVREMSSRLVEFRQESQRAILPMYPRIREIERRQEEDAQQRAERQIVLDRALAALERSNRRLWTGLVVLILTQAATVVLCVWLAVRLAHVAVVALR